MKRSLRFGLFPIALVLAGTLRADDQAASAPAADDVATLRADNKQLTEELAASWKEADKFKADLASAQSEMAKSTMDIADLKTQLDLAKVPTAPVADSSGSVADLQDKLATSLRSFTVLQDENATLKASVEKLTAENQTLSQLLDSSRTSVSSLQVQAAATSQIDPLRDELRQTQDEASHLASENARLRDRLSLQVAAPSSLNPAPTRPGSAAALAASAPPAPAAPPAKTYVVVEGDTLTKIARKFYGSSARWAEILKANDGTLKDEKSLVVGSTLKIP
jgi:nucleoid-associated protein YgaU